MTIGFVLSLLLFLSIIGVVIWTVLIKRQRAWYEFLPTFFWQGIMVSSFIYQYYDFDQRYVDIQGLSIAIFSIAIFVSDWIKLPQIKWFQSNYKIKLIYVSYTLMALSIGLQLSHLYLMPEIPLVTMSMDKLYSFIGWIKTGQFVSFDNTDRYMKLRESSSKLLDVPLLYIYLCQATLLVFAPFALHILVKKKKVLLATFFLCFCLFYSRASLAKGTLYLFVVLILLQIWFIISEGWRKHFLRSCGAIALVVALYCSWVLATHPSSIFIYKAPPSIVEKYYKRLETKGDVPQILTNADHGRLFENSMAERALNRFEKYVNFFAYRAFFVPAEVSHFWYMYYPDHYGKYLGFYGLSPSTRSSSDFVHPANGLGLWAYQSRFPQHYYNSVRAYCSIDADAHARWGFLGVVAIALILFIMRIFAKLFRVEGRVGIALYASLLFIIGSALPAASIFAMVLANGVFMYFALLGVMSLFQVED